MTYIAASCSFGGHVGRHIGQLNNQRVWPWASALVFHVTVYRSQISVVQKSISDVSETASVHEVMESGVTA